MNPALILTHNCLELTKKCVASLRAQDVETEILLFDNGSTDGTLGWAHAELPEGSPIISVPDNFGVSYGWNAGIRHFFDAGAEHVLVVNNDTILPPWFYRNLLAAPVSFVTGNSTDQMENIAEEPKSLGLVEAPDFSAFLIHRELWEQVGPFNEDMKLYASDCDYHIRAHRLGLQLWNCEMPFYHERSSTYKTAAPKDRRNIGLQADADREVFRGIYGCIPGDAPEYKALFA
jgi:GT2 family glycosyltransferase